MKPVAIVGTSYQILKSGVYISSEELILKVLNTAV